MSQEKENAYTPFQKLSKEEKTKKLLDYVKHIYETENRHVSKREIRRVFHVELFNYFENTFDMYKKAGIKIPLRDYPKEEAKMMILDFVRKKTQEGIPPLYA